MPRRVNAALAACLVGVSEKTMTNWFRRYGEGWGAEKHPAGLGRPEEWDIGMVELHTALAHRVREERIAAMIEWIDLHRGTGGTGPTPVPPSSPSDSPGSPAPTAGPPRRSLASASYVPGRFGSRGEAINFLLRHGINSARTARDWDGWPLEDFTPENVLRFAYGRWERLGWRARWKLTECVDDPGCVCHSMSWVL